MKIKKAHWPDFRDKLLPIVEQTERKNNHRFAKQIDKALFSERAFLFLATDGFFVLRPIVLNHNIYNEVLFAYSFGINNINKYQPVIERLTQEINGKGIIVYTALNTVVKVLLKQRYQIKSVNKQVTQLIKEL